MQLPSIGKIMKENPNVSIFLAKKIKGLTIYSAKLALLLINSTSKICKRNPSNEKNFRDLNSIYFLWISFIAQQNHMNNSSKKPLSKKKLLQRSQLHGNPSKHIIIDFPKINFFAFKSINFLYNLFQNLHRFLILFIWTLKKCPTFSHLQNNVTHHYYTASHCSKMETTIAIFVSGAEF